LKYKIIIIVDYRFVYCGRKQVSYIVSKRKPTLFSYSWSSF